MPCAHIFWEMREDPQHPHLPELQVGCCLSGLIPASGRRTRVQPLRWGVWRLVLERSRRSQHPAGAAVPRAVRVPVSPLRGSVPTRWHSPPAHPCVLARLGSQGKQLRSRETESQHRRITASHPQLGGTSTQGHGVLHRNTQNPTKCSTALHKYTLSSVSARGSLFQCSPPSG